MGAKLTLTGVRSGKLRKTDQYYAFELVTGGSPTAPKGLPVASAQIEYTVFVSLKAGRKAGLDSAPAEQKWFIQGEPVLDVPVSECPGEIGVIAFQVQQLPSKEQNADKESQSVSADDVVIDEVAVTAEQSDDSVMIVPLEQIRLSEEFQGARLNFKKTAPVREWIQKHGRLDKPLEVRVEGSEYWLVDGYRRYVIAQEEGFTEVPVRIV